MALGAESNQVRRPVVAGALSLTAVGATIGGVGALLIGDTLDALLFGVGTTDPLTFATMVGVLAGVSVLASWLPARRADRTDPVSILRAE